MSDDEVVLVDDEDVPLAVDALWAVVVGEGGVEALGLVPADGVVDEEFGVFGRGRLGRNGGNNASGYLLYVGGSNGGLGLGDIRYGSSDALIHNILHFGTGKSCVLAVTATGQQRKQQYGHDSQRDRSESIHAQPLLPLSNCLIWTSFGNRTLQSTNILSIGIAVYPMPIEIGDAGEFRRLDFEVSARNLDAATTADAIHDPVVANP